MSLNFFRRVAFGLSPSDKKPYDPLPWALNQLNAVPEFLWPGSIPTEKELRKKYKDDGSIEEMRRMTDTVIQRVYNEPNKIMK